MMPLKLPATKLLETREQSKPQAGLPHQPIQLSIPFCKSLEILPSAPMAGGLRAGRQVSAPEFGSSGAEGPTLCAHHTKSR